MWYFILIVVLLDGDQMHHYIQLHDSYEECIEEGRVASIDGLVQHPTTTEFGYECYPFEFHKVMEI